MDNMVFIDDISKLHLFESIWTFANLFCLEKFCKSKIKLESLRLSKAVEATELNKSDDFWRPLMLFIPLRLGLTDINPVYFRALKSTFAFPQTLGILGGRPNHALYFIGCCGDDLVYLDPHTTQPTVNIADDPREFISPPSLTTLPNTESLNDEANASGSSSGCESSCIIDMDDISYHCERASRLPIAHLDPSISLCFLCRTEEDFDQWANLILKKLIQEEQQPLFEIMKERPANWPMFEEDFDFNTAGPSNIITRKSSSKLKDPNQPSNSTDTFTDLESDEDYEIID